MFGNGKLIRCQQHKATLLQESATHRSMLAKEAQNLRPVARWVDLGMDAARKARMGCSVVALLLSLRQTRKQETSGFVHKLAEALAFGRLLTAVWKGWD